jgi:repressor LexA
MTRGERIRKTREDQGISQVELAERIGESKQTLYKYEAGIITNVPAEKIELIAHILDVSPAWLMGWQDNKYAVTDVRSKSIQLSDDEMCLVKGYRAASSEGREYMLLMASNALKKGEEVESSNSAREEVG